VQEAEEVLVDLSTKEYQVVQKVAQKLGLSVEEAGTFLVKLALAKRASRPVRVSGRVISFPRRKA
jgi:ssDNA-binding replication factor A large subunit